MKSILIVALIVIAIAALGLVGHSHTSTAGAVTEIPKGFTEDISAGRHGRIVGCTTWNRPIDGAVSTLCGGGMTDLALACIK